MFFFVDLEEWGEEDEDMTPDDNFSWWNDIKSELESQDPNSSETAKTTPTTNNNSNSRSPDQKAKRKDENMLEEDQEITNDMDTSWWQALKQELEGTDGNNNNNNNGNPYVLSKMSEMNISMGSLRVNNEKQDILAMATGLSSSSTGMNTIKG